MLKSLIYYIIVALVSCAALFYAVRVGERVGEENYKHSKAMQLALESMYNFGLHDCMKGQH